MKMKIFEIENFRFSRFSMRMFDEFFRDFLSQKNFVGRFQNSLIMVLINRFGQNFVQNYVEFNGGGDRIKIKVNRVRGRPLQKKIPLCKKIDPFRKVCPVGNSESGQLTIYNMYRVGEKLKHPLPRHTRCDIRIG